MNYRAAEPADFPEIVEFLDTKQYFCPVNPDSIGGHWVVAEQDGKIRGTVWYFAEPPNCYVDYWAADGPRVATRLLQCLYAGCVTSGLPRIHGMIASDNKQALRFATEGFGVLAAAPYHRIYKELPNGKTSD